ncbi:hypothetical protein BJ970_006356 [Saccharopolyspora phatthalungensis]|uniref:Uncharacterized protein n=1 Tax=Saccharopolyspora phatthalungensis TaxID=664693 RepID=A0A840QFB5_9PSEU|nr:hypothetical protein [Saccharopolyspora phatthalungensis]
MSTQAPQAGSEVALGEVLRRRPDHRIVDGPAGQYSTAR